jgi:hypothetical protein
MSEIVGLEQWLYETLLADNGASGVATLVANRIFVDEAPQGAVYPFVLISAQADGRDVVSIGPHRVMVDCLYWIRVVGQGASKKALQTIYSRLDSLLQAAGGVTSYIRILMVNRESQPAIPPATVNGLRYVQLGGVYRAYVQAP